MARRTMQVARGVSLDVPDITAHKYGVQPLAPLPSQKSSIIGGHEYGFVPASALKHDVLKHPAFVLVPLGGSGGYHNSATVEEAHACMPPSGLSLF